MEQENSPSIMHFEMRQRDRPIWPVICTSRQTSTKNDGQGQWARTVDSGADQTASTSRAVAATARVRFRHDSHTGALQAMGSAAVQLSAALRVMGNGVNAFAA